MDNVSIGVTPIIENVTLNAGVNNQVIDITLIETAEVVQLDITPNLIEVNIIRSEGEVQILQFASYSNFPATGKANYFYLAKDTNKLYRWTGSTYAEIGALGYTAENTANKGIANGYAGLDSGGKVPSSQLPSYVDDVIEVANYAALPATGETGKIYITLDTNNIYRWSGSVYVEISTDKAVWGGITGTLGNQTDLVSALAAKQNNLIGTGYVKSNAGVISYVNETYLTTADAGNTYVPYTGAISDVNLGSNDITAASFVKSGGTSSQFLKADGSVDSSTYALDSAVVHNTGTESVAGFKTFTNEVSINILKFKEGGGASYQEGYSQIGGTADYFFLHNGANSKVAKFIYNSGGPSDYVLPATSGTLALTSEIPSLAGYVPTTRTLTIDGTTQDLSQNRTFAINFPITSFNTRTGAITLSSTDVTTALGYTPYNATNPNNYITASALAPYLLLAGGTMTGQLNGTSASYSGNVTALAFIKTGGTSAQFLKADGTVDSSVYALESRLINTSGPLSGGGSLAADRTISISKADTSTDGYLSSTDWDTFNEKQDALNDGTGFVFSTAGVITYDTNTYLTTSAAASTYVPYTGANANVDLGTHTLSSHDLVVNHTSGSGVAASITKGGNGEALTVVKSSGSGNAASITGGVTLLDELHLNTDLADAYIASASTWNAKQDALDDGTGFVVSTAGAITYDTSTYVPTSRTLTINGTALDLSIDRSWTIDPYTLPIASASVLGGIKVGSNLSINATTGVLDATYSYTLPTASTSVLGGVKVDGSTITINGSGVISASAASYTLPTATDTVLGGVKIGSGVTITSGVISVSTNYQAPLNGGTGLVYSTAGTITYDTNTYLTTSSAASTYLTQSSAASTYLPLTGGTLTGALAINRGSGNGLNVASDNVIFRSNTGIGSPRQAILSMGGGTLVQLQAKGYGADYITDFGIQTFNNSGAAFNVFYGTSAGLVGIGTTTPNSQFEVYGSTGGALTDGIRVSRNSLQTSQYGVINYTSGILNLTGVNTSGGGEIRLNTSDGTTTSERMRITSAGNVGIGTTSPVNLLGLQASSASQRVLNIYNGLTGADTYVSIGSQYATGNSNVNSEIRFGNELLNNAPSYLAFATATGSSPTERMRITSGGDVFINATSTINSEKLFVKQSSSANLTGIAVGYGTSANQFRSMSINSSNVMTFNNGTNEATLTAAGAWSNASDARLKKNIIGIKYGLNTILESQPRSFNRVDVDGDYIGFIAQELLDLIPEVVSGNLNSQYCVDYGSLVAISFQAIKELKAELDTLKNK